MATYSQTGSINKNYKLNLIVTESDVNKINNTSKVNWKVTLQATGAYNFAQINSTVKVVIDGDTVYNKSSYKTVSANSTITIASGSKTITHNDDGSRSVVCKAVYDQNSTATYTPGDMTASGTLVLTQIDRGNKAICPSFSIGNDVVIAITKYDNSTTTTVKYQLGTLSGTLAEKTDSTTVGWEVSTLASQIYAQIPESNSLSGTISTETYDSSGNQVGTTQTSNFTCNVINSNPIINSVTFVDTLGLSSNGDIIRYLSNVQVTIMATARNGANLTGTKVSFTVEDESGKTVKETANIVTFGTLSSNKIKVQVVDSRGNYSEKTYTISEFIEYIKPTISYLSATRTGDEELTTSLTTIRGQWYNGEIDNVANTLTFKYRYKTSTGNWSEYITFIPTSTLSGNNFELEELLIPTESGFSENEIYNIEVSVIDALTSDSQTTTLPKAIPLTDHWEDDDGSHYNINAEIQQNGFRILRELFYSKGDTLDIEDYSMMSAGHVTSSKKNIEFTVITPKNMINISNITLSELKLNVRTSDGGYIGASSYTSGGYNFLSSYTVTATKVTNNAIRFVVTSSSAFDCTNNIPVTVEINKLSASLS